MQNQPEQSPDSTNSPLLFSFITKFKFNSKNLNFINDRGVTPITAAIDSNQQEILLELLMLKANPLIENIHGNTALTLSKNKPLYLQIVEDFIKAKTCDFLDCDIGKCFHYDGKTFQINTLVLEGSCCLVAFELQDCSTLEKYFAKVKSKFGGLEVRNYIFLQEYVDLFMIKNLQLKSRFNEQKVNVIKNTYCIIVKLIPGQSLTLALKSIERDEERKAIIVAAITALADLHAKGYIHNDALPNNCFWNCEQQTATFIDYDVMRMKEDLPEKTDEYLEQFQYADFERLIIGDFDYFKNKNITFGLSHYIQNMPDILLDLDDKILNSKFKNKLCAAIIS